MASVACRSPNNQLLPIKEQPAALSNSDGAHLRGIIGPGAGTLIVVAILALVFLGPGTYVSQRQADRFSSLCMQPAGGGHVATRGSIYLLNNSPACKEQVRRYFASPSGQYFSDTKQVSSLARAYFTSLAIQRQPSRTQLVVFDIDETVLSNMVEFSGSSLDADAQLYSASLIKAHAQEAVDRPAIQGILELYTFLYNSNYSVAFVTGRKEGARANTAANLLAAGYGQSCSKDAVALQNPDGVAAFGQPCYIALHMRHEDDNRLASVYKPTRRKLLQDQGYEIVGNIGDQFSDLDGQYAAVGSFKMPNPVSKETFKSASCSSSSSSSSNSDEAAGGVAAAAAASVTNASA